MASRTRARLNNLNDRAREVGLSDVLTLDDIDALKAFYNFTCLKCGANPAISPDHVKPLSSGGANTVENLQLLCDNCNKAKQDQEIDYRNGKVLTRELADAWIRENKQDKPQKKIVKNNLIVGVVDGNKTITKRTVHANFHGKKGRSGRKPRSREIALVEAFNRACSPDEFEEMTLQLKRMFYDTSTVQDEEGNILRLQVDASTRVRIWEKFAAYAMGEPTKRVETGKIGELQEYMEELMGDNEKVGDADANSNNVRASWIQTPSLN